MYGTKPRRRGAVVASQGKRFIFDKDGLEVVAREWSFWTGRAYKSQDNHRGAWAQGLGWVPRKFQWASSMSGSSQAKAQPQASCTTRQPRSIPEAIRMRGALQANESLQGNEVARDWHPTSHEPSWYAGAPQTPINGQKWPTKRVISIKFE